MVLSPYLKRIIIDILLFVAFAFGFFYTYNVFLDFLISLFHFEGTRNIPSIAYCIQRSLYILIPIVMLTVSKNFSKIKLFKGIFFVIGCCYLIANTWIINYMLNNSFMDLVYASIPRWFASGELGQVIEDSWNNLYLFQYNNAMVFNYLIWDSYDLWAILFSTIQGILYIRLSIDLDTSRPRVLRKLLVILLLSVAFPLIYNIVVQKNWIFSSAWAQKNIMIVFESFFIFVALNIAATSRNFWHDVLW